MKTITTDRLIQLQESITILSDIGVSYTKVTDGKAEPVYVSDNPEITKKLKKLIKVNLKRNKVMDEILTLMYDTRKYKVCISEVGSEYGDRNAGPCHYFPTLKEANAFMTNFNLDESNKFTNDWFRFASYPIKKLDT